MAVTLFDAHRPAMVVRKAGRLLFEDVLQRYDYTVVKGHWDQPPHLILGVSDVSRDVRVSDQVGHHSVWTERLGQIQHNLALQGRPLVPCVGDFYDKLPWKLALD